MINRKKVDRNLHIIFSKITSYKAMSSLKRSAHFGWCQVYNFSHSVSQNSKGNEQKHLLIENSEKFGQFWVNSAASRPKNSTCAPAACV